MPKVQDNTICRAQKIIECLTPTQWLWVTLLYVTGIFCASVMPGCPGKNAALAGFLNFLHIPAYAGLACLLFGTLCAYASWHRMTDFNRALFYCSAFVVAVGYGVLNEFVQANIPGRDFSLEDMVRNAFGALAALAVIRYFLFRR